LGFPSAEIPSRKKIAIVALARKLLVTLWAMLRDNTAWRDPCAPADKGADGRCAPGGCGVSLRKTPDT